MILFILKSLVSFVLLIVFLGAPALAAEVSVRAASPLGPPTSNFDRRPLIL